MHHFVDTLLHTEYSVCVGGGEGGGGGASCTKTIEGMKGMKKF